MPKPHKLLNRRWFNPCFASILCLCLVADHVAFVPFGCVAVNLPRVDLMKRAIMYVSTLVPYSGTLQCHPKIYFVGHFVGSLGGALKGAKETR